MEAEGQAELVRVKLWLLRRWSGGRPPPAGTAETAAPPASFSGIFSPPLHAHFLRSVCRGRATRPAERCPGNPAQGPGGKLHLCRGSQDGRVGRALDVGKETSGGSPRRHFGRQPSALGGHLPGN